MGNLLTPSLSPSPNRIQGVTHRLGPSVDCPRTKTWTWNSQRQGGVSSRLSQGILLPRSSFPPTHTLTTLPLQQILVFSTTEEFGSHRGGEGLCLSTKTMNSLSVVEVLHCDPYLTLDPHHLRLLSSTRIPVSSHTFTQCPVQCQSSH